MERGDLPTFPRVPDLLRNGRSIRDGYARGWGLEFGDLASKIVADPLYVRAVELAEGRTVQSERNRMNIYLLIKFYLADLPSGHVVEFGSYRGGSAIFMASLCQALHPETRVFAFDTYEGMPPPDGAIDAHTANDFGDVDFADVQSYVRSIGLTNLELVRGRFEDTAPRLLPSIEAIRLCHIDCDIRSSVLYSYEAAKERLVDGGYIVFDDALYSSCLGATEVVEDVVIRRDGLNSEQVYPQFVFRLWNGAEQA